MFTEWMWVRYEMNSYGVCLNRKIEVNIFLVWSKSVSSNHNDEFAVQVHKRSIMVILPRILCGMESESYIMVHESVSEHRGVVT